MSINASTRPRKRQFMEEVRGYLIDCPPSTQVNKRENFVTTFQKATQIYECLKVRSALCPLFLPRNLQYLNHRMSRSNKSRANFKIEEMLKSIVQAKPNDLQGCENIKLLISGYVDPDENGQKCVKVSVIVKKTYHRKRNDVKAVTEEFEVCTVKVPRNPENRVKKPQPATALIPTRLLKFDITVKSYTLKFIVKYITPEAKMVLGCEVPLCELNSCSLLPGYYTFLLFHQQTGDLVSMTGENHTEALDKGPNLKAQVYWISSSEKKEAKKVKPMIQMKQTETLMKDQTEPLMKDQTENKKDNDAETTGLKIEFVFVKNRRSYWPCATEVKNPLMCPWCKINCGNLYSMLMHLNLCHPRFSFVYKPNKKETEIRIEVSLNKFYDGSYVGNQHDLISRRPQLGFGRNVSRRSVFTEVIVDHPQHKIPNLDDFSEPIQAHQTYIRGHKRVYFNSETNLPMSVNKDKSGGGGDMVIDKPQKWMLKLGDQQVDDFTDVNEGEKSIFKMWNDHVLDHNYIADVQMKEACFSFVETKGSVIIKRNLYNNFVLHMTCLFDNNLISAQDMYSVVQALQQLPVEMKIEDIEKLKQNITKTPKHRSVKIVKAIPKENRASVCDINDKTVSMPPLKEIRIVLEKLDLKPHETVIVKTNHSARPDLQKLKRSSSVGDSVRSGSSVAATNSPTWQSNYMIWQSVDKEHQLEISPRERRQSPRIIAGQSIATGKDLIKNMRMPTLTSRQLINLLYGLELLIQNPQQEYTRKFTAAMVAWERITSLASSSVILIDTKLLSIIISVTMRLILHDDWETVTRVMKSKLVQELNKVLEKVEKNKYQVANLQALKNMIVEDPWNHPAWNSILQNIDLPESVREELVVGTSLELVLRLEVLLTSGHEDAALEVASLAMHSFVQSNSNLGVQCRSQHKMQIIDWYTQLLYKKQQHDVFEKGLPLPIQDPQLEYVSRVIAALFAWERQKYLPAFNDTNKMHSIISGTMRLVLHDYWKTVPGVLNNKLNQQVKHFLKIVEHNTNQTVLLLALLKLIKDPWGHPTWQSILNNVNLSEGVDKEELVVGTTSLELVLRLEVLLTSGLEDAALEVASMAMHSFVQSNSNLGKQSSSQHKIQIIDWYTQLLYKKQQQKYISEKVLKCITFDEGVELVKRISSKSKDALLKDCSASDIALLCASSLLTHSISKSSLHIKTLAELASVWAYLHQKKGTRVGIVTKKVEELLKQAQSSQHVYALCSILQEHKKIWKELCDKLVQEVVFCLGRDINKREEQKGQSATVTSADIALSYGFSQLAKLFSDDNIMYRECLLSSFSLNPTKEMYSQLVKVAGEKDVKKPENKQSSEKNKKHKTVKHSNRRNSKLQVSVSNMSVKSCIDLSNIINKVRVGRLSWSMPWHELSVLCQQYFLHPKAHPLTSTRKSPVSPQ